jgi:transcriptional regulator with XRE-family HTH domain
MLKDRLRKVRRAAGVKQSELADALSVHTNTVSNWERGVHVPDEVEISAIARALGVTVSDLVDSVESARLVCSRSDQAAWIAGVIRSEPDPDVAFVLATIGAFVDAETWLSLVSLESLESESPLSRELLEQVWPRVMESKHLRRKGSANYAFSLVMIGV